MRRVRIVIATVVAVALMSFGIASCVEPGPRQTLTPFGQFVAVLVLILTNQPASFYQ